MNTKEELDRTIDLVQRQLHKVPLCIVMGEAEAESLDGLRKVKKLFEDDGAQIAAYRDIPIVIDKQRIGFYLEIGPVDAETGDPKPKRRWKVPRNAPESRCSGCGMKIFWIKTVNGKNMPLDPDGTCHFETCPEADQFRGGRKE